MSQTVAHEPRVSTLLRRLQRCAIACTTVAMLAGAAVSTGASSAERPGDVLTSSYDNARTGANLRERTLATDNVRPGTFGRQFTYTLDAPVFSQALVVTDVDVPGPHPRNLVIFTTTANSVFAFDADGDQNAFVWRRTIDRLPDGKAAVPRGIMSTPVIDRATGTLYVVAGFLEGARVRFVLHALDLADGSDKAAGPVAIEGSVSIEGTPLAFEPTERRMAIQRAGLALAQGRVIVAFGGDFFEGWVFSFDAADLRAPSAAYCTTCASRVTALSGTDYLDEKCTFLGPGGGIWQGGRAPVVDPAGQVLFFTANKAHIVNRGCPVPPSDNACSACRGDRPCVCEGIGSPKVCRGPDTCIANRSTDGHAFDTHDALIRLDPARGLALTGWFRPDHWNSAGPEGLELNDLDLGSAGPVLLPGTDRVIGAGKQGVMYLLDAGSPAESCAPSLNATCLGSATGGERQSFRIAPAPPSPNHYYRHVFAGPVVWDRPAAAGGPLAFVWRENDHLRSYRVTDRFEDCRPIAATPTGSWSCESAARSEEFIGHPPGGILALSANGADPRSAIVWASTAQTAGGGGRLVAFQAVAEDGSPGQLAKLWDSDACGGEDTMDAGSGFVPPTISNGRVYVPTQSGRVEVYGIIPPRECRGGTPGGMPPTLRM